MFESLFQLFQTPPILVPLRQFIHYLSIQLYNVTLPVVAFFSVSFYFIAIYGLFYCRKKRKIKTSESQDFPSVTIQIPTLNEPVAIRCAEACLNMDYPRNKMEIIIGDDSTDPKVSKKLKAFARKHNNVKVTKRETNEGYKPGNLNHMLKYSNGDIIVIFDSDFVPPRNFLKKIVKPFLEDERVACVQAKWDYMNIKQNKVSKFASAALMVYHNLLAPINNKLGVSLLFGSAEAVRKDVLIKLGGWKNWSMTEDVEFSLRALKEGYRIIYLSDIKAKSEVPFTLHGLAKQQKRWAYGNTKAFLQHAKWIIFSKKLNPAQKFFISFTLLGYISAPLLVFLMFLGFVIWFTGTPESINIMKFSVTTTQLIIINSGFLSAMLLSLGLNKKLHIAKSVVVASVTVGVFVAMSVFDGLMKAFFGKRMKWFMIEKRGNLI